MSKTNNNLANAKICPTCGAAATAESQPFCSKRCADIDLGRWFQGAYAIPVFDSADDSILDAELEVSGKPCQSDSYKSSD